jgi:iron complex outermembrane receptor protein
MEVPTKPVSPTATFITNLEDGYVLNNGIELGLNGVIFTTRDFSWNVNVNFTTIKNKAVDIRPKDTDIIPTGKVQGQGFTGAYAQAYANNRPMASFYMVKVDYIDSLGRIFYEKKVNNTDTLLFQGSPLPKYSWGINNTLRYRNFDLSFFIEAVQGNLIFNNTAALLDKSNLNQAKNALTVYVADEAGFKNSTKVSNRYLEDGSYVRLTNATLGYNFNVSETKWIRNLRLYVSGSNLFLITDYSGYDPDVSAPADMNGVRSFGIDLTSYPKARTLLFGLNVIF